MKYKQYDPVTLRKIQQVELGIYKEIRRICDKYHLSCFALYGTAIGVARHKGFIPWDDDMDIGMLREDYETFLKVAPQEFAGKYKLTGPDCADKYYNLVPNVSKVGTRFIHLFDSGNFNVGILVDIFPLDYTVADDKLRKKQEQKCLFWRTLYLLRNVNFYKNHLEGDGNRFLLLASAVAHHLLRISPLSNDFLARRYKKWAVKYNDPAHRGTLITRLGEESAEKSLLAQEEMFPLVEMPYEDTTIHMVRCYDKMLRNFYGDYMQLPPEENRKNHYPNFLDFGEEENAQGI